VGISHPKGSSTKEADAAAPVKIVLREALKRKWHHLAQERIEDVKPTIPLGECFWPPSKAETLDLKRLFQTEEVRKLITGLRQRDSGDHIRIADAAYWVKGCSSLGRLR
jgi:hypothetical protein